MTVTRIGEESTVLSPSRYVAENVELAHAIFTRPIGITDPDVLNALDDRAGAIEHGYAWVREFGDVPKTRELYDQWVREVATGAAYFDRWGIENACTAHETAHVSHEQEAQRSRVLGAAQRARDYAVVEDTQTVQPYALASADLNEPPTPDFGPDL